MNRNDLRAELERNLARQDELITLAGCIMKAYDSGEFVRLMLRECEIYRELEKIDQEMFEKST